MSVDEIRRPKPPPPPPPPPPPKKDKVKDDAAEAHTKATEAQRDVGQARADRDKAQKSFDAARQDASDAKARVKTTEDRLGNASPQQIPQLQKDLDRYKGGAAAADAKVEAAGKKLQSAEERVVTASKAAEDTMREANAAAAKANVAAPFSEQQIRKSGVQVNEVRDAFDGAEGRRRTDLANKLGFQATTDPKEIQGQLEADRQYAKLYQDPAAKAQLDQLGIKDGQELRAFGQRIAREAQGGAARAGDKPLQSDDPAALQRVIEGAGQSLSGEDQKRLTDPTFSKLVAEGNDPKKVAAGGPALAQMVYKSEVQNAAGKPPSEWNHADAAKYTDALAKQVEAHKDDPEFVRSLLTLSSPGLQKSAELVGAASNENFERGPVEALTNNLSRIGNAAPDDAAARLAWGVASKINEDSEQHYVDDGFQKAIDGGGSSKFRDLIAGALSQQGKGDAAEELTQAHGGSIDWTSPGSIAGHFGGAIADTFEDLAGKVGDVASDAWDFGGKIVGSAADFAVKAGGKAIDFAGDAAEWTGEQVKEGLQKAVELGLKVTGKLMEAAQGLVKKGVTEALNIDGNLKSLKPGDSYSIGGSIEGSLGIKAGIEGDISVKRNDDGSFTVSAGGKLHAGLGAGGEIDVGAGGKAEFTFSGPDALQKATQATQSLAVAGAGLGLAGVPALGPAFAAAMAPKGDDLKNLTSNMSALELDASASAKLDGKLGFGKGQGADASASGEVSYRIEFGKDGSKQLVRNQTLTGSADLGGVDLKLPGVGSKLAGASAEASITKTTRMDLPDSVGNGFEALGALADPTGLVADASGAKTSISGSLKIDGNSLPGGKGAEITFSADNGGTSDLASASARLLHGDLKGALDGLDAKVEGHWYTNTGFNGGVDAKIAGVGISVTAHNQVTHVGDEFEVNL